MSAPPLAAVLERIPYLGLHHLVAEADEAGVRVLLEPRPELVNHVGIFHAGALYTAAETAAGVAAWRTVPGDRAYVLLRGATVRYTRRAEGPVSFGAEVQEADADDARRGFAAQGRADLVAHVQAHDASGTRVFEGSFDYALRPRPPEARP